MIRQVLAVVGGLALFPGGLEAAMGMEAVTGTVAAGKSADLVLLDADPQANIRNTRHIAAVVIRGRLLDRAALDGLLAQAEAAGAGKR